MNEEYYLPKYQYDIIVTPDNIFTQKHQMITDENEWQKYWGNVGAKYVNNAKEKTLPYMLAGMASIGNPIGALAGFAGGVVGEEIGANFGPHGKAIGGFVGGTLLDPTNIIKPDVKDAYNFINHGLTSNKNILPVTGRPNTLRRFVGTGTSGLDDAIETGIIRGKTKNPVPHTAHELTKYNRKLHNHGISEDVIRRFNSGELTEDDWNIIAPILNDSRLIPEGKRSLIAKKPLSDSFNQYKRNIQQTEKFNRARIDRWDLYGPRDNWSGNWNGHNMATFAKYKESLSNKDLFPGDFGVEIRNADKWAVDATPYGHSELHPVTFRPIEFNHPDVTWYKKSRGWIDRKPFMKKMSASELQKHIDRVKNI